MKSSQFQFQSHSKSLVRAFIFGTFAFATSAFAQSSSVSISAGEATLPGISLLGTGCPANTGAEAHWEGSALVVNFGKMVAEKGQGVSLLESRKNCAITLDLDVPDGLSYAIAAYVATGYDQLSDKDSRNFTLSNFFQGQGQTGTSSSESLGTSNHDFKLKHFNSDADIIWSPCNVQRAQTVNVALRIGNGGDREASSSATLDNLRLYFTIKPC